MWFLATYGQRRVSDNWIRTSRDLTHFWKDKAFILWSIIAAGNHKDMSFSLYLSFLRNHIFWRTCCHMPDDTQKVWAWLVHPAGGSLAMYNTICPVSPQTSIPKARSLAFDKWQKLANIYFPLIFASFLIAAPVLLTKFESSIWHIP